MVRLTLIALLSITAFASDPVQEQFERLKSLAGQWQGTRGDRVKVDVTYEIIAGGSVVMERMAPSDEPNMITMYHLDGSALMMTHYCSAGNQPRMYATTASDDTLTFAFKDATGLEADDEGHMKGLAITFKDQDHIRQTWTFHMQGEDKSTPFELTRKH